MRATPLGMRLFKRSTVAGSGSWLPSDLGSALVAWYDFSDLTTLFQNTIGTTPVASSGDPIHRINDKSGNGHYLLSDGTAGHGPIYTTGSGLAWGAFNGSTQYLSSATSGSVSITDGSGQHSAGAAVLFSNNTGTQSAVDADLVNRVSQLLRNSTGTSQTIAFSSGGTPFTDSGPSITSGSAQVMVEVTDTSATEVFVNGTGNGSTAVTGPMQTGVATITLGAHAGTPDQWMTGNIYAAVLVNRNLTPTERANLTTYLGNKCGLSL